MTYPFKYKFIPNVPTHDIDMEHRFWRLIDTPTTYSGYGKDFVTVKEDESGLEFTDLFTVVSGFMFFKEVSDDTMSTTTSTQWQEKVSLEIFDIPAGRYRIGWFYEWQMRGGSFNFNCRVRVDDATNLMEQVQEPADSASGLWHPVGGFGYITLAAGGHHADLDFCSSFIDKEACIRRGRLEFWRIS